MSTSTDMRRTSPEAARLRELIAAPGVIRAAGAHDALSAKLAELAGCDAVWASGLGISTVNAVPDIGLLSMTELLESARQMRRATRLPIIADCDSGAEDPNLMRRLVQLYEDAGIAAVCIEDKQYPKRNSFRDGNVLVKQEDFARRIEVAKSAQHDPSFTLIARIESLIANQGLEDAVSRGRAYADAGADMLLIHSKSKDIQDLAEFASRVAPLGIPLVAVPTTYPQYSAEELASHGFRLVIYANQMLRASVRAMTDAIHEIVKTDSSESIEDQITPVSSLFELLEYNTYES